MKVNLSKDEINKIVAKEIISLIKHNPKLVLGLATGSTMIGLYKEIVSLSNGVDWSQVKTFNLDEYVGVDENDEISYHYYMKKHLFRHVNINIENTFFPTENNYHSYESKIEGFGGIDCQLLGVGGNGHIAFNEPGSPITSKTRIVDLAKSTIKANTKVISKGRHVPLKACTVGIDTILRAKKIICLAFGESKKEALLKYKDAKITSTWPITYLLNHKNVEIYTDLNI